MQTRREVLGRTGRAVLASAAVGLAGCSGDGDDAGAPADPVSVRWLPAPTEIGPHDHYPWTSADLAEVARYEDDLPGALRDTPHDGGWEPIDVDWPDVSRSLAFQGSIVIAGDYNPSVIIAVLRDYGWRGEQVDDDTVIFADEAADTAAHVGEDAIVLAGTVGDVSDPVERVRLLLDTANGDVDRYVTAVAPMGALTERLADGTIVQWQPARVLPDGDPAVERFPDLVGIGTWASYGSGAIDVRYAIAVGDEPDLDSDSLEAFYEDHADDDGRFAAWTDVSVSRTGRIGVIAGSIGFDDRPG